MQPDANGARVDTCWGDCSVGSFNTNIASGLRRGREKIQERYLALGSPAGVKRVMILLTDGAPKVRTINGRDPSDYKCQYWASPHGCTDEEIRIGVVWDPSINSYRDPLTGDAVEFSQYKTDRDRKLRTLEAIREADDARDSGITVFAIGLGEEDPWLSSGASALPATVGHNPNTQADDVTLPEAVSDSQTNWIYDGRNPNDNSITVEWWERAGFNSPKPWSVKDGLEDRIKVYTMRRIANDQELMKYRLRRRHVRRIISGRRLLALHPFHTALVSTKTPPSPPDGTKENGKGSMSTPIPLMHISP